jgi:putative endonuclease
MTLAAARTSLLERVIHTLDRVPFRRRSPIAQHLVTGKQGELAACFYLRRDGYIIVARDWKSAKAPGDIDLVAWDAGTLCFIEVKTRTTRDIATAESAIDEHKRRTLRRLASHYLRQQPEGTTARFDVVSIYFNRSSRGKRTTDIELFRGVFDWSAPLR